MARYGARLRALEARLMPPEGQQHPTVIWTITDTDNPPEWAEEAIRPHLPAAGVAMVQWHQSQQAGEYCVDINLAKVEALEAQLAAQHQMLLEIAKNTGPDRDPT